MARATVRRRSNDGQSIPARPSKSVDQPPLDQRRPAAGVLSPLTANVPILSHHKRRSSTSSAIASVTTKPAHRATRRHPVIQVLVDPLPPLKRKRPALTASITSDSDPSEEEDEADSESDVTSELRDAVDCLPFATSQAGRPRRGHVRTVSLPSLADLSLADVDPPIRQTCLRGGRSVSDSLERARRSSRSIADTERAVNADDGIEPACMQESTPIAHRTRQRSSNLSIASMAGSAHSRCSSVASLTTFDENEDDELDSDEGDDSAQTISAHQQARPSSQSPRRLRNGKVVTLGGSEDEDGPEENEESDQIGEDHDVNVWSPAALLRRRRTELVEMCRERDLRDEGLKRDLVQSLVRWRATVEEAEGDDDFEPEDGSSSSSMSSSSSLASTPGPSPVPPQLPSGGRRTPLLLASNPRLASHKPDTPDDTADDEDDSEEEGEDIGTLDLDSLGLTDRAIAPERLKRGEKIGSGGFKDVYVGRYRNCKVAIADLRGHLTENDIKELSLLRDLQHPHIVRFIGVSVPDDPRSGSAPFCSLVTEICLNGDLFDYLRSGAAPPSQRQLFKMMLDIILGLEYLHTRTPQIIHRDMKSSNVLITAKGVAKINDFGLARVKTSNRSVVNSLVGTVNWQAPELWAPKPKYNEKVDVYATGLVFWEMLQFHMPVKRYPFEGSNEHAIYQDMGLRPPTATMGRRWGSEILQLVNKMWAQLAVDRPSMSDVRSELEGLIAAL